MLMVSVALFAGISAAFASLLSCVALSDLLVTRYPGLPATSGVRPQQPPQASRA